MTQFTSKDRATQATIKTLLEQHIKQSTERHEDMKEDILDHEIRIRKGESFRYKLIGWAVGAGLISAQMADVIKDKIGL